MAKNEVKECSSCGGTTRFALSIDFRVGGNGGQDLKVLFPELPKTNEGILPLDVYVCEACGQVRFFAPKDVKNSLLNVAARSSR